MAKKLKEITKKVLISEIIKILKYLMKNKIFKLRDLNFLMKGLNIALIIYPELKRKGIEATTKEISAALPKAMKKIKLKKRRKTKRKRK